MTRMKSRNWLMILLLITSLAVAGVAAGCGGDDDATTTSSGSTGTTGDSTVSSVTDSTIVQGGKSLEEYQAEIPELEKALAANPEDLASLEALAVAHYQLGEYEGAIAAYQKILALAGVPAKDGAFIHNALGNVYRDQKQWDLAIAEYEESIALDPTLKHPYINLAGVYKAQGNLDKALEVLDQAKEALNAEDAKTAENYQTELTSTTTT